MRNRIPTTGWGSKMNAYIHLSFLLNWQLDAQTNLRAGNRCDALFKREYQLSQCGSEHLGASIGLTRYFGGTSRHAGRWLFRHCSRPPSSPASVTTLCVRSHPEERRVSRRWKSCAGARFIWYSRAEFYADVQLQPLFPEPVCRSMHSTMKVPIFPVT